MLAYLLPPWAVRANLGRALGFLALSAPLFTDVTFAQTPAGRLVVRESTTPAAHAVLPGATNVVVQQLSVQAIGLSLGTINRIALTLTGELSDADIERATVWVDDTDAAFGAAEDSPRGSGIFTGRRLDLMLTPPVDIPANPFETLFVTFNVSTNAPAGQTFGVAIRNAAEIGSASPVEIMGGAASAPLRTTFQPVNTLPFSDGFDAPRPPANRTEFRTGEHPIATGVGARVSAGPVQPWPGEVLLQAQHEEQTRSAFVRIDPRSGGRMAALRFRDGRAVAGLDYSFDLSRYDAMVDEVFIEFQTNTVSQADDPQDHVFISVDAGESWAASVHKFEYVPQRWTSAAGNLSQGLRAAQANFTADVLLRIQSAGDVSAQGARLVDDVWIGVPERVVLERMPGVEVSPGGRDEVGRIASGIPIRLRYQLRNGGSRPLAIVPTSFSTSRRMNVSAANVTSMTPGGRPLDPNQSATVEVSFMAGTGAFGLDVTFNASDPRLPGGVFRFTIGGNAVLEPELDLELSDGTPVPSGGVDDLGRTLVVDRSTVRTYRIASNGGLPLNLTGTRPVALENVVNVMATVSPQPPARLASLERATFNLNLLPMRRGQVSLDLVIVSDDVDEGTYRVTVSGTAEAPEIDLSLDGMPVASGETRDLGRVDVGARRVLNFRIDNSSQDGSILTLQGMPFVEVLSGVNADVRVTQPPMSTIASGAFAEFQVEFTPVDGVDFSFDVRILSSDANEGDYRVTIDGRGFGPEIEISRDGTVIENNGTDEQSRISPGGARTLSYTIDNRGDVALTASSVAIRSTNNATVSVTAPEVRSFTVAPRSSQPLELTFTPGTAGSYAFVVEVTSNDASEGRYRWTVQGDAGSFKINGCGCRASAGSDARSGAFVVIACVWLLGLRRRRPTTDRRTAR